MSDLPVPAAERTLRLLETLQAHPVGIALPDLEAEMGLSRSSLFALLHTLKTLGYVEQSSDRAPYLLGPRARQWTAMSPAAHGALVTAYYGEAARAPVHETLALAMRQQDEVMIVAQVESRERIRSAFEPGQRLTLDASAAGPLLQDHPPATIQTLGYSVLETDDTTELAVPVCADGQHADAALIMTAPHFRCPADAVLTHLSALQECAARISYRLGAVAYTPYQRVQQPALGPLAPLAMPEISAFLRTSAAARLACIRPDGTPHVVPVWYDWDGAVFYIAAWHPSRWGEHVLANPAVSLSVDELGPPLRRVTVRGAAKPLLNTELPPSLVARLTRLTPHDPPFTPPQPSIDGGREGGGGKRTLWQAFGVTPDYLRGWRGLPNEAWA